MSKRHLAALKMLKALRLAVARKDLQCAKSDLKDIGIERYSFGVAIKPSARKKVDGKRIAYYKPRFKKVGDEYKYARKNDGNVSYTVVNPESITRTAKQRCLRKYRAWLRKQNAERETNAIVFTLGLSKADALEQKRYNKKLKYMR